MDKGTEVEKLKADLEMERTMHIKLNGTTLEPPPSNKELEVYKVTVLYYWCTIVLAEVIQQLIDCFLSV